MTLDSQLATNGSFQGGGGSKEIYEAQDALMCSLFAHADGLAFGSEVQGSSSSNSNGADENHHPGGGFAGAAEAHSSTGNRPSTLLLCGRLDAFTCGQLVAMAEHRAAVKAWIWEIDPFPVDDASGGGGASSSRTKRTEMLRENLARMMSEEYSEEDDDDTDGGDTTNGLNLSTKTILRHYANTVKNQRRNHTASG